MNDPSMDDARTFVQLQAALEVDASLGVAPNTSEGRNSNGARTVALAEDDAERQHCRASPYNVRWSMRALHSRHTKAR